MSASGDQLTFKNYEAQCNRLAHIFVGLGLHHHDHVAFLLENSLIAHVAQGAAERCGLFYTPVNYHLSLDEIVWIVNNSTAQAVIVSARFAEHAQDLVDGCPEVANWLFVGPSSMLPENFVDLDVVMRTASDNYLVDARLGSAMLYSSGTTGRPRGILRKVPDDADPSFWPEFWKGAATKLWNMRPGMVFLQPAPYYHSSPQGTTSAALRTGGTTVIMEWFDPERFLELIEKYRVTHMMTVPTMLSRVIQLSDDIKNSYDLSSLESVNHSAAPCPTSLKRELINWLGPVVYENYGSTEANGATIVSSAEWLERVGTVGRSVLGETLILGPDGAVCEPGDIGEVWFAGETNFEYFNDAQKTEAATKGNGLMSKTGDLGFLDEAGYLFLTDRQDFTIIAGGVNIYPQEVEDVLLTHPHVADAAVIGVPNTDMGEEVKAIVELIAPLSVTELTAFCQQHLATYKCPRTFEFVERLPRTPTGKIRKAELKAHYGEGAVPSPARTTRLPGQPQSATPATS
jgi:acyl-CoA synthetase (AMP-forming)/AMP-acid ligase II